MEVKPLIFYKTTADFDNTGEVLIYKSLLEYLREYGNVIVDDSPHIQPLFLSRIGLRDDERLHQYTTSSFTKHILLTAARNILVQRPIYFVTGVGDHVVKSTKDVLKNLFSFIFLLLIRIGGVKVLRIGMSIKFDGALPAISEKLLSKVITHYYVRDTLSLTACKKAGVKASLAPDLSWGYRVQRPPESNEEKDLIILSFRDYVRKGKEEPYKSNLYNAIGHVIEHLCRQPNMRILLTYQCDYDRFVCEEIYNRFHSYGNIQIANELITLDNANEYYGNASIVLSNRLHVLLLGYKYGALTIALTDIQEHTKIVGIFDDEGLTDHLISINQSPEMINNQLDAQLFNLSTQWQRIHKVEEKNSQLLQNIFRKIFEK